MKSLPDYSLPELKTIYQVLQRQLPTYPQLMEGDFLDDLQRHLQQTARAEGIDVASHNEWAAWLDS